MSKMKPGQEIIVIENVTIQNLNEIDQQWKNMIEHFHNLLQVFRIYLQDSINCHY